LARLFTRAEAIASCTGDRIRGAIAPDLDLFRGGDRFFSEPEIDVITIASTTISKLE